MIKKVAEAAFFIIGTIIYWHYDEFRDEFRDEFGQENTFGLTDAMAIFNSVKTLVVLILLLGFNHLAYGVVSPEVIEIKVGTIPRPPFLAADEATGAAPEVLAAMNRVQNQFEFTLVSIPTKRRIRSLSAGLVDIMMWDNPAWGWQKDRLSLSVPLVANQDIFLALKQEQRTQSFFDDLTDKRLVAVHGYYYRFADFVTDESRLSEMFDISLVSNEELTIKMLLAKRADIAVVSTITLNWFLLRYPQYREELMISERVDTSHERFFLVPQSAPIRAKEINDILIAADRQGLLSVIYQRYGLEKPDFAGLYQLPVR
ncbi:transporter substrate-binding domain-containing protein [Thalassomonas viridans]|uniref:Transporter substrate-binding domain-containing protein n=1 Tax=Thalassomonas viridans TaxID=137584 RepID=A0AAE9Z749_9GAMM|nr:ABC transporter substrate-binding protein [Thalassomonas viridans]WDE06503.1 transporter substrate-binding domain-containing protein [Thalassomonas viridans]